MADMSSCVLVHAVEIVQVKNCAHDFFVSVFPGGTPWHLPVAGGEHFWQPGWHHRGLESSLLAGKNKS